MELLERRRFALNEIYKYIKVICAILKKIQCSKYLIILILPTPNENPKKAVDFLKYVLTVISRSCMI
ncbi:hypothetical protein Amet_1322 [Alkaliphilus metalliredigens QYMF]|uniref:Uncharacterized protein n=1 Tax=Alkaliphilus metalliredigens (strain QYMF) TaxID=293826 RepID=A6TMV6_ALKMQ|nr:hypothetical protein Amet_1322 [Alkaliphilus metalliredigens QYMF]